MDGEFFLLWRLRSRFRNLAWLAWPCSYPRLPNLFLSPIFRSCAGSRSRIWQARWNAPVGDSPIMARDDRLRGTNSGVCTVQPHCGSVGEDRAAADPAEGSLARTGVAWSYRCAKPWTSFCLLASKYHAGGRDARLRVGLCAAPRLLWPFLCFVSV